VHNWTIAVLAAAIFLWGLFDRRLEHSVVTPAMFFVTAGVLFGSEGTGWLALDAGGHELRAVAEVTLTLVLFTDASRLNLRALRHDYPLPARLLGVGLPLTIGLGTVLAKALFGGLTWIEAGLVGVILAPTDAALGQAVVTDPALPIRISQGLNVESGLNDGICVPLLFILLAANTADEGVTSWAAAVRLVFEQIGYGLLGGLIAAVIGSLLLAWATRHGLTTSSWRRLGTLATAAACYGLAAPLGGSGFIAAFAGGLVFGWLNHEEAAPLTELVIDVGQLFEAVTFIVFGAVVVGPLFHHVDGRVVLYAALSLTVIRMLPVAVSLLGSHARLPTVGFIGWFGPRGLASIVFVVIVTEGHTVNGAAELTLVVSATVLASVYLHGLTAVPLAARYANWFDAHPRPSSLMESGDAYRHPGRWHRHHTGEPPGRPPERRPDG
jgi:NhaP-type Na+/H+ or K+/H+ antiporter